MKTRTFLKYWLPVVIWMLIIFGASTDFGSAQQTSRFLLPLLRWINPKISTQTFEAIQLCVRKAAHVTEYAILGALLWRAFRSQRNMKLAQATLTFVIAVLYAALDEYHQSFVSSRTASPYDVMIDAVGALLALIVCSVLARRPTVR